MSTADAVTASALTGAVAGGDYTVDFTRQGAPASRSYHITEAPSADVLTRFQQCNDKITKFMGN